MALFTTLYSGSSGNCGLVREGNQYLLVDMGKSCRSESTRLNSSHRCISYAVFCLKKSSPGG